MHKNLKRETTNVASCCLFIELLHLYFFYKLTDEDLEISLYTGTNRFRLASNLQGTDHLIREVSRPHTEGKNTQTQKLDLKVS